MTKICYSNNNKSPFVILTNINFVKLTNTLTNAFVNALVLFTKSLLLKQTPFVIIMNFLCQFDKFQLVKFGLLI